MGPAQCLPLSPAFAPSLASDLSLRFLRRHLRERISLPDHSHREQHRLSPDSRTFLSSFFHLDFLHSFPSNLLFLLAARSSRRRFLLPRFLRLPAVHRPLLWLPPHRSRGIPRPIAPHARHRNRRLHASRPRAAPQRSSSFLVSPRLSRSPRPPISPTSSRTPFARCVTPSIPRIFPFCRRILSSKRPRLL